MSSPEVDQAETAMQHNDFATADVAAEGRRGEAGRLPRVV